MATDLQRCFERNGYAFDLSSTIEAQLREALRSRRSFVKEGYRATMSRFRVCTSVGEKATRWWELELFERSVAALAQDYRKGRKLNSLVKLRASDSDSVPEDVGSTNTHRVGVEDRVDRSTLRDARQSAIAMSALVLRDRVNQRVTKGATMAALPLKD